MMHRPRWDTYIEMMILQNIFKSSQYEWDANRIAHVTIGLWPKKERKNNKNIKNIIHLKFEYFSLFGFKNIGWCIQLYEDNENYAIHYGSKVRRTGARSSAWCNWLN